MIGFQQFKELHTSVNHKTMPEAEEVRITTMINQCTNTEKLAEELDQQADDETKITALHANVVFESSAETILEHEETDLTQETTLVNARTMLGAEEVETTASVYLLVDNTMQLLDELHHQDIGTKISVTSTEHMYVVETKDIISREEVNYGLQQVEELHGIHGLSSKADVTEDITFVNDKTMCEAEDVENNTVINQDTHTLQLVEELDQQGAEHSSKVSESSGKTILVHGEAEITKETVLVDAKTVFRAEEIQTKISIDLVTNNSLHQQDDESGISAPFTKLSNKVSASYAEKLSQHGETENRTSNYPATNPGKLAEDLRRQGSEFELTISSIDVSQKLSVEEVQLLPTNEHKDTILIDHVNDQQIVEDLCQDSDIRLSDESAIATVKPRLNNDEIENPISTGQTTNDPESGTVSNIELLADEKAMKESHTDSVVWDDQKHEKAKLNEKKIKIAKELRSLNQEMDEKLKKIEELAQHVLAIDAEISQMEFKCRESKGRHADFIDLYKFMAKSQLPLRCHSEIRLLMKKMDKAAQQRLSNALDLQFNIEARAKLKLSLQEERNKLGELVEAQKLEMQQKLNETVSVIGLEEAADPDMAQSIETATNCIRKRKADDREDLQAKRMTFDVVTNP